MLIVNQHSFWECFEFNWFYFDKIIFHKIKDIKKGDYTFAYLLWYGVVRFIVEHFRSDSLMFLGLKSAQLISIIFIVVGGLGLIGIFRKEKIMMF